MRAAIVWGAMALWGCSSSGMEPGAAHEHFTDAGEQQQRLPTAPDAGGGGESSGSGGAQAAGGASAHAGGIGGASAPARDAAPEPVTGSGGGPLGAGGSGTQWDLDAAGTTPDSAPANPCECSSGPCCDRCHFYGVAHECDTHEYESLCSLDANGSPPGCPRTGYHHSVDRYTFHQWCTGHSSECDGRNLVDEAPEDCAAQGLFCYATSTKFPRRASCVPCP